MRDLRNAACVIVFGVVAGLALGCGSESLDGQRARGVVKTVDVGARKVTLDHEAIRGLMNARTMMFDVAPRVALGGLGPGAEVLRQ